MIARYAAILFVLMFLVACGTDSGPPPTDPTPTNPPTDPPTAASNNAAVLEGAPIGSGDADVQQLQKEVQVNLSTANANFELGTFYATRDAADTDTMFWVLPITNLSEQTRCFVQIVDIRFRDGTSSVLSAEQDQFVDGSVGVLSSIYTNTCLAPEETSYIQGIQVDDNAPVYSALESVDIAGIESSPNAPSDPNIQVIAQSYSVSATGELAVQVKNEGSELGYVTDAVYTLLDAEDRPLFWDFLDRGGNWDGALAPDETRILVNNPLYRGQAETIRVVTDFDNEPSDSGMSVQGLTDVEANIKRLRQRNNEEGAKLERLEQLSSTNR